MANKKCKSHNFSKEQDSGDLNFISLKGKTVEEIINEIEAVLGKVNFSTSLDSSKEPDTYQKSINSLIDTIIEKLKEKTDLSITIGRPEIRTIRNHFKSKLLPKPLTKVEISIQNAISGIELVTEDERRSINFRSITREIYGSDKAIDNFRQSQFEGEMRTRMIIDTKRRVIIDDIDDLNSAIREYQVEQFKVLTDYLKSLKKFTDPDDTSKEIVPSLMYYPDGQTKIPTLTKSHVVAFQMMYNIIHDKKKNKALETELENGWMAAINGQGDASFYNAVNAYVNLVYFDDVIKEAFGEYLSINYDYAQPIVSIDGKKHYKYSFTKGNSNNTKHFGEEVQNALAKMSKFQQILIRSIPIYDYETTLIEYGNLEPKDFIGSFAKLLDIGSKVSLQAEEDFVKAISIFQDHPEKALKIIFERLFINENAAKKGKERETQLLTQLKKLGLDDNSINYIYSVYRTCFKGKNSWNNIESDYIKEHGYKSSRYSLIDTLFGVMDSNVIMNYLQTTYNYDQNEVKTSIKSHYSANRTKFDIINNVNSVTIDRENKDDILSRFKIQRINKGKNYSVTLNSFGKDVTFKLTPNSKINLLSKQLTSNGLTITGLDTVKEINLSDRSYRRKLASRTGLTEQEQTFMTILDFIDTMLGTSFGIDGDGIKEFRMLLNESKNNLNEIFASAVRALLVTDIYSQFEKATKPSGEKYTKVELLQFLSDNDIYSTKIEALSDREKKEYFIKRYDGWQLNSLRSNQKWIEDLSKVRAILTGATSKSVLSNLEGDKIPVYGPGFLGARIEQQLKRSKDNNSSSAFLLFPNNPKAIRAKVVNTDVQTKSGLKKSIKQMTQGELLYDAIVNKFIIPYLDNDKSIYTQPTTYSDKTKFLLYQVSLEALEIDLTSDNLDSTIEQKIQNTIGKAYEAVYKEVSLDYAKIFPEFVVNGEIDISQVQYWMKTHKEQDLIAKASKSGVTVYRDVHYRQMAGKKLSINELLYNYANGLFKEQALHNRLQQEKQSFIKDLLSNRLSFRIDYTENGELDSVNGNAITKFIIKLKGSNIAKSWIRGDKLILAKIKRKNGTYIPVTNAKFKLQPGEEFIINPVLNAFFMVDNLIGNNLRFSLTGSEINHKVKALAKLNLLKISTGKITVDGKVDTLANHTDFIRQFSPTYDRFLAESERAAEKARQKTRKFQSVDKTISFYELSEAIQNAKNYISSHPNPDVINELQLLEKVYNEQIYKVENGAQNAQFKRNVIIPGTMRYYLQGRLNGIGSKMKIAVIEDLGAKVFNFDGKSDKIDAHDGSALENPFTSILENWSLQDCEVGTVKKPIQHWYDDRFMSATLLKYAVDTITNQWMRQSEGNNPNNKEQGIMLRHLFKKMTNVRWHKTTQDGQIIEGAWKFGPIDLISGCAYRDNPVGKEYLGSREIDFREHILEATGADAQSKRLFYIDGNTYYNISNFGIENGVYYTEETQVDNYGNSIGQTEKVYHYFNDKTSEHTKSKTLLEKSDGFHTVDSLFELHTAFGGIYSASLDEEGILQYSEASNFVVAKYINNVAEIKPGADPNDLTQDSYYQPLKEAMIDVLANNSAVKNGAGNMNPTSSFYDDTDFKYIVVGTNGYGIQMDADHEADEGHMTEFSQVISSLDAGGRLHDYVSQIYETLGQIALDLSGVELDAIEYFRESGNKTKVVDIIGRTLINNLSKNKGQAGLANAIIDNIKEGFNLNTDHALDEFKIPFSDPNIYSTILSTFVSIINKKSIKRQYPGQGTVMVPGYNMSMIYDIDGKEYQFEDLIKKAYAAGFTPDPSITDISQKNRDVVRKYLQSKQNEILPSSIEEFQPTENVRISYIQLFNVEGLDNNLVEYEIVDKPWESDPTKVNKALNVYIKGQKHLGYFQLVKDYEDNYYSVHFKTGDPDTGSTEQIIDESGNPKYGSTSEQRAILYQQLYNAIPDGAKVSTYGNISDGGLYALNKLMTETIFGTPAKNIVEQRNFGVFDRSGKPIEIPVFQKLGSNMTYEQSTSKTIEASLDDINDYYLFKDDIVAFLNKKGIINPTNITYQKNIMVPRNLAPVKISWQYEDENRVKHTMNIFDHWRIKGLYLRIAELERLKDSGKISGKVMDVEIKKARKEFKPQQAFDELEEGKYVTQDGKIFKISNLKNTAAELIMSNLYRSKFGLSNGDSLADILDKGEDYFVKKLSLSANSLISSESYDLAYTKSDGRNLYITFKPIKDNDETFDSTKRAWNNVIPRDFEYPAGTKEEDKTIIQRMFYASKDNIPLFEVGRKILRDDVQYDKKLKKFVSVNQTNKGEKIVMPNQSRFERYGEDKVLEKIFFISNNLVTETQQDGDKKYKLYNINREEVARVLHRREYTEKELTYTNSKGETKTLTPDEKFDQEVDAFISHLLAKIYQTEDFNGMQLNTQMSLISSIILENTLYKLGNELSYDSDISSYIKNRLYTAVTKKTITGSTVSLSPRFLRNALLEFNTKLAKKQYASFLKSQEFIVSRIPAQTLQSFMQMRNVGFTGVTSNQCFVSHWQTW